METVLGKIKPDAMGITLVHEHLLVKPNRIGFEDYTLDQIELACEETQIWKEAGGGMIIDMTPHYYGRNIKGLMKISSITSVPVGVCTGFHKEEFMPPWLFSMSVEELADFLIKEITLGLDETNVLPMVLKAGTSYQTITAQELKVLKATAMVYHTTKIPISTHCDQGTMGKETAEILMELGVPPSSILLGHMDLSKKLPLLEGLCEKGVSICLDHIGRNLEEKDQFVIDTVEYLEKKGYIQQIFISQDMGRKKYLHAYGGKPGLDYVLKEFKSHFLEKLDIGLWNQIMIENPKRFFTGTIQSI